MERLNKFLAHAGVGSRRHCDSLIAAGRVKVDGRKVSELGLKIDPAAHQISVDDQPVKSEKAVYWAVNKPVGYICSNSDPDGRPLATDLLPHVDQRVYTVGRLDEASEGLLLMTNDGELAHPLMHPRFGVPKTYQVLVAGKPTPADLDKLLEGVWLSEGRVKARAVRRLKPQGDSTWLRVVLTEGKNREIRRMMAKLGHKVMRLKRVAIGPIKLDRLPKGKARRVSEDELKALRAFVASAGERMERARAKAAGSPDAAAPAKPSPRPYPVPPAGKPRPPRPFNPAGGPNQPPRPYTPANGPAKPPRPFAPAGGPAKPPRPYTPAGGPGQPPRGTPGNRPPKPPFGQKPEGSQGKPFGQKFEGGRGKPFGPRPGGGSGPRPGGGSGPRPGFRGGRRPGGPKGPPAGN